MAGLFASRKFPWVAALLTFLLTLPVLGVGWQTDDYVHQVLQLQDGFYPPPADPVMNLFTTADGDAVRNQILVDRGMLPWWSDEELKFNWFRPLAGLLHRVQHRVAPRSNGFTALVGLVLVTVAVGLAALLYRALIPAAGVAGLAALLYALDEAHGMAAGWVAHQNAILAFVLGVATLLVYVGARSRASSLALGAAVLLFAATLAAGEAGVAVVGYLVAYELTLARDPWPTRARSLLAFGLVTVAWRAIYVGLGYGAHGSGLYLDPLGDFGTFANEAWHRGVALLVGQWTPIPADLWGFVPDASFTSAGLVALAGLALLVGVPVALTRADPVARFFALGMFMAVVPMCATFPMNRGLFFVGLGAMGVLACFLGRWLRLDGGEGLANPVARGLAVVLLVFHLVLAPLVLPWDATSMRTMLGDGPPGPLALCLESTPRSPEVRRQTFVIVNAVDLCGLYLAPGRHYRGEPAPASYLVLGSALADLVVTRIDERTVELRPRGGFQSKAFERLWRSPSNPLQVGYRRGIGEVEVEITGSNGRGLASAARFRFAHELEDPSYRWFAVIDGRLTAFEPPGPGDSREIRASWWF